jgi:hypothetical protein
MIMPGSLSVWWPANENSGTGEKIEAVTKGKSERTKPTFVIDLHRRVERAQADDLGCIVVFEKVVDVDINRFAEEKKSNRVGKHNNQRQSRQRYFTFSSHLQ